MAIMEHFEDKKRVLDAAKQMVRAIVWESDDICACEQEEWIDEFISKHCDNIMQFMIEDNHRRLLDLYYSLKQKDEKIANIKTYLSNLGSGVGNFVLELDGNFTCKGIKDISGNWFSGDAQIIDIYMRDNKVYVSQDREGNENESLMCPLENMALDDLDRFCTYFDEQKKKNHTIRVTASRTWTIPADTWEDALKIAKADLKANPLYDGDIDGWD